MTESSIEQRLRDGLASAAASLPAGRAHRPPGGSRPKRRIVAVAAGAVLVAGAAAAAVLTDREQEPGVTVAADPEEDPDPGDDLDSELTEATVEPSGGWGPDGSVPGQAVVVDDEIRLYGPDGEQTGTVSIDPLENAVDGASSDLVGGWVICSPARDDSGALQLGSQAYWFPAGGEAVALEAPEPAGRFSCTGQVSESPYGPMTFYYDGFDQDAGLVGVVLATGETHELPVRGMVSGGRAFLYTDRLYVHDVETGEAISIADLDPETGSSRISPGPDGKTMAVVEGAAEIIEGPHGPVDPSAYEGPVKLRVLDLETGDELYSEQFSLPMEGLQLSYDGEKVAVGNYYEGNGPVAVIDLESGDRHTIDANGRVL